MAVLARTSVESPAVAAQDRARRHELALGAAAGGVIAGAAMLAFAAFSAARIDESPAQPLQLAAAVLLGEGAIDGGAVAALVGLLLWGAVSVALALAYAAAVPRDFPFASAAMMGVGYAFITMGIVMSLVLPAVNPLMKAEMSSMGGSWVLAYAVFGLVLGIIPRLRSWLAAP